MAVVVAAALRRPRRPVVQLGKMMPGSVVPSELVLVAQEGLLEERAAAHSRNFRKTVPRL
ncbi:MAG TPA: hypothetical protein VK712_00085 [Verrucomicrobiae bacterium]|nr:hypothetical protein [Verrucomicrobiae bacterium]